MSIEQRTEQRVQTVWNQMEQRAIKLLGSGTPAKAVAQACGVSDARISQLMSMDNFREEVALLKYNNLQKHSELDSVYDEMEMNVAEQLKELLPLICRPGDLLKAAQVLNGMKRRGVDSQDGAVSQSTVVTLLMPTLITQKFTTNINNQVINAGSQTLETIQGSALLNAAKAKQGLHNEKLGYTTVTEVGAGNSSSEFASTAPKTISITDL